MDSGNSGSLQSSSGGEEEYDSRTESISSFLNSSAHFGSLSAPSQPLPAAAPPQQQQQLLSHHHNQGANLFGHHSQNLDPFQQSLPNHYTHQNQSHNNHDVLWSRGLRSDSGDHGAHFGNIAPQSVLNAQLAQPPPPSPYLPATDSNAAAKGGGGGGDNNNQPTAVKNPKKRTRASRRAPTTVLTTDTSNFRQMVQEFTGIPTAPYSAGGSSYSRRLDLFSTGTSNLGPLYPLRPSAQKPHHQNHHLSPPSNTFIDSANSQNLLNMQNQMLSFQPNNPNPNPNPTPNPNHNIPSFLLAGKTQGMMNSSSNNSASLPSFDELGLGHNVNAASLSSELWRGGGTAAAAHVSNYSAAKYNCSGGSTAPEFLHHEKGLENVTSGGEGTVGSWICPSD